MSLVSPPSSNGWTIPLNVRCLVWQGKQGKEKDDLWIQCIKIYRLLSYTTTIGLRRSEAAFGRNPDKSLKSVPPCYSTLPTALPWDFYFFKITQPLTVSAKKKGGKLDRKLYPLPYALWNPYRNLKSENFQDYAQKPVFRIHDILVWIYASD